MENNFLNDLKKSLDSGGAYNSEAAKKIMEITELSKSKSGDVSGFIENNKKEAVDKETAKKVNSEVKQQLKQKQKEESEILKLTVLVKNLEKKVYDSISNLSEAYDSISTKLYPKRDSFTEAEQSLFDLVSSSIIDIDRILNSEEYRSTKYVVPKKNIGNLDVDNLVETGNIEYAETNDELSSENEDEKPEETETNN